VQRKVSCRPSIWPNAWSLASFRHNKPAGDVGLRRADYQLPCTDEGAGRYASKLIMRVRRDEFQTKKTRQSPGGSSHLRFKLDRLLAGPVSMKRIEMTLIRQNCQYPQKTRRRVCTGGSIWGAQRRCSFSLELFCLGPSALCHCGAHPRYTKHCRSSFAPGAYQQGSVRLVSSRQRRLAKPEPCQRV
jgi:hypothetical protein